MFANMPLIMRENFAKECSSLFDSYKQLIVSCLSSTWSQFGSLNNSFA